jgi:malonyl-CoA/methylmalonyl-CoA synthetase
LVFQRADRFGDRLAIIDSAGSARYRELIDASARVARALLDGNADLNEHRVAFLEPPGRAWVALQWGIWRAGGLAVPLASSHPPAELDFVLRDAEPVATIAHSSQAQMLRPLAAARRSRFLISDDIFSVPEEIPAAESARVPELALKNRAAMMLYTSGTTGRPKGVVTTHANVRAQITTLVDAWGWSEQDRILHVLPLHHVHGIINVLSCALWSGGCCEFLARFDPEQTWSRLASGDITVFMAVPTIYHRLIAAWDGARPEVQRVWASGSRRVRLMVSGSAALPVRTLERWREITGHTLLERYGMTEIGMALSNPLHGERRAGAVGTPLPGVMARITDDDGRPVAEGTPGQIEIRGPQVFREYWRRPEETRKAFRAGWFLTGDEGVIENGYWRILGRRSTDILKSGGYKISALEIEDALREHPGIRDCAVVSVPDDDLGERVCAAIVPRGSLDLAIVREWMRARLAPYKVPKQLLTVEELPRNAMGKVVKPSVRELFLSD